MFVSAEEDWPWKPHRGVQAVHGATDQTGEEEWPPPAQRHTGGSSFLFSNLYLKALVYNTSCCDLQITAGLKSLSLAKKVLDPKSRAEREKHLLTYCWDGQVTDAPVVLWLINLSGCSRKSFFLNWLRVLNMWPTISKAAAPEGEVLQASFHPHAASCVTWVCLCHCRGILRCHPNPVTSSVISLLHAVLQLVVPVPECAEPGRELQDTWLVHGQANAGAFAHDLNAELYDDAPIQSWNVCFWA